MPTDGLASGRDGKGSRRQELLNVKPRELDVPHREILADVGIQEAPQRQAMTADLRSGLADRNSPEAMKILD